MSKKIGDALFYISLFGVGYVVGKCKGFCKGFVVGAGANIAFEKSTDKSETVDVEE